MQTCVDCGAPAGTVQMGDNKSPKIPIADAETPDTVQEASEESFPASDSPAWAMDRDGKSTPPVTVPRPPGP